MPIQQLRISAAWVVLASGSAGAQPCIPSWSQAFAVTGTDAFVYSSAVYDDDGVGPHGPALYLGSTLFGEVWRWDGISFTVLPPIPHTTNRFAVVGLTAFDEDGAGPGNTTLMAATTEANMAGQSIAQGLWRWDGASWVAVVGPYTNFLVESPVAWEGSPGLPRGVYFGRRTAAYPGQSTVVRWDGTLTELPGVFTGQLRAMRFLDDDGPGPRGVSLIVGGINLLTRWDGTAWSSFGTGPAGWNGAWVSALEMFDDDGPGPRRPYLYAGGSFETAGGIHAVNIARWDGAAWSGVGDAGSYSSNAYVASLRTFERGGLPALYAAGSFSSVGGTTAINLACFTASGWSSLGSGPEAGSYIQSLSVFDDDGPGPKRPALCGTGVHTWAPMVGGIPAMGIARWDGDRWIPFGQAPSGPVRVCQVLDDGRGPALYAAGEFVVAGGLPVNRIARWDGTKWEALGEGLDGNVLALGVHDDGSGPALYCGGAFLRSGGLPLAHIARWDGTNWSPLGAGVDGPVFSLASFGGALYVGGNFATAAGITSPRIARWNGTAWSAIPAGADQSVDALCVHDEGAGPRLFAGGWFSHVGGTAVHRVARFDGSAWSDVGGGTNNRVHTLASFGGRLYAGGRFSMAGQGAAVGIANWDGQSWQPLGPGLNNHVDALVATTDNAGPALYVGGKFTSVLGAVLPVSHLARWSGSEWSALNGDADGNVSALAVLQSPAGTSLFVGGEFRYVAGLPTPFLASKNTCACYANCDASTTTPILNVADFICFLNRFAAADALANCDGSTLPPTLNVQDFVCFLNRFAAGCP